MAAGEVCNGSDGDKHKRQGPDDNMNCQECLSLCLRAKIITVEPVTFFYMLGMYFTLSFSFQYYFQRYARDKLQSANHTMLHHYCISDDDLNSLVGKGADDSAEDEATHMTFLTTMCSLLVSIASTVIIGPLTDQFGRKFALASANFGSMISSLLVMTVAYMELDLHYFIVANAISSLFGGFGVLLMGTFSYIADISSHETRSLRIGILELMIYISSAITSVLSGIWLSEVDCNFASLTWAPFLCYVTGLLYTLFVLPESLSKNQRLAKAKMAGGKGLAAMWKGILLYFRPNLVTLKLWICLGVLLIVVINFTGSITISTYFYIRHPLQWTPEQIGLYGSYSSVTHGLSLLLLMPIALAVGVTDVMLAIIGILCSSIGYLFIAGVRKTWQMYAISSFQGIEGVVVPSVRSMMSKYVSKEEQGALFSFVASVEVSASLIGSSVYTNLYPTLHQTSYFVMSVLAMVPVLPLCLVLIMEIWMKRARSHVKDADNITPRQEPLVSSVVVIDERSSLLTN